jgi:hypothetical protein
VSLTWCSNSTWVHDAQWFGADPRGAEPARCSFFTVFALAGTRRLSGFSCRGCCRGSTGWPSAPTRLLPGSRTHFACGQLQPPRLMHPCGRAGTASPRARQRVTRWGIRCQRSPARGTPLATPWARSGLPLCRRDERRVNPAPLRSAPPSAVLRGLRPLAGLTRLPPRRREGGPSLAGHGGCDVENLFDGD